MACCSRPIAGQADIARLFAPQRRAGYLEARRRLMHYAMAHCASDQRPAYPAYATFGEWANAVNAFDRLAAAVWARVEAMDNMRRVCEIVAAGKEQ